MLPSWIIEEIKKREQDKLRRDERPHVELPLEPPPASQRPSTPPRDDPDRDRHEDGAGILIDLS
ncbi:MAG: hypothetical protein HY905_26055 [Deltaproteobacteria bacterium]|nr:hypothetical protein [Deltaproteobacteria bacterium]